MKFGKHLEGQQVPEWQEAYCNYRELKKDIKRICQTGPKLVKTASPSLLKSLASMSSTRRTAGPSNTQYVRMMPRDRSDSHFEVIAVRKKFRQDDPLPLYQTELLEPLAQSMPDQTFFSRLDTQLNKVNRFHKKKEDEYVAQAARLEKQMRTLLEMRETLLRQVFECEVDDIPDRREYDDYEEEEEEATQTDNQTDTPLLEIKVRSGDYQADSSSRKRRSHSLTSMSSVSSISKQQSITESRTLEEMVQNVIDNVTPRVMSPPPFPPRVRPPRTPTSAFRDPSKVKVDVEPHISVVAPPSALNNHSSSTSTATVSFSARNSKESESTQPSSKLKSTLNTPYEIQPLDLQWKDPELEGEAVQDEGAGEPKESEEDQVYDEKRIDQAVKLLRKAFISFYRGLILLTNFRTLNTAAFAKIVKKYDKAVGWKVASLYMKEVDASYFATSVKIGKLMSKVEDIFTKYFADGHRKKAMSELRPSRKRGTHRTTYFLGLFSGSAIALFITLCIEIANPMALQSVGGGQMGGTAYLNSVFNVISPLFLFILHIYLYGWNVYSWQRTRINYSFIFEFAPGTELRYREILVIATGMTNLLLGGMVIHVVVAANQNPRDYGSEFIPLVMILLFFGALLFPFDLLYRSSRIFFLRCTFHIICAPFFKVVLSDFFLGDQFTSQNLAFRNMQFGVCYYMLGYYKTRDDTQCRERALYQALMYVVSLLPYWWRLLQCLRRYWDDKDSHQLQNAVKYASIMVAVGFRTAQSQRFDVAFRVLFIVSSAISMMISLYWDLVIDWGLLRRKSKNSWLRDQLVLKKEYLYFIAMVANSVLRLAWLFSVTRIVISGFNQRAFDIIVASLEVFRRGIWNFFRLENEHLNNVGKYRAVKNVPLPFRDDD